MFPYSVKRLYLAPLGGALDVPVSFKYLLKSCVSSIQNSFCLPRPLFLFDFFYKPQPNTVCSSFPEKGVTVFVSDLLSV